MKYWEEYQVGDKFRSRGITVTETHLVNWAGLTMDYFMIHTDKEYAAKSQFKQRLAHGPLIFGLAIGLIAQEKWKDDSAIAWLGAEMKMVAPVFIGDTIYVDYEVLELTETSKPSQGIQVAMYRVVNQNDKAVMEIKNKFMMHRKPL